MAKAQYDAADNMTDRQGALSVLTSLDAPEREEPSPTFTGDTATTAWCSTNGSRSRRRRNGQTPSTWSRNWRAARTSPSENPNRWRALVGNFAANQWSFHHASGRGYRFLADMILEVDKLNPQVAARQVPSLGRWRRFESGRATLMRAELERIVKTPGLSKDVFEQASKSLA